MDKKKPVTYLPILGLTNGLAILALLSGNRIFLFISVGIGSACILFPAVAKVSGRLLDMVKNVIGKFLNALLLLLTYFLVLTPLALAFRLVKKKDGRWPASTGSFFLVRSGKFTPDDMRRQG